MSTRTLEEIDRLIAVQQLNSELYPSGDPNRGHCLVLLSTGFWQRHELTALTTDLDKAVAAAREAAMDCPPNYPTRPAWFLFLCVILEKRYDATGALDDLDQKIAAAKGALEGTPEDHPEYPTCLGILGQSYGQRFQRTNAIDDLNEAIASLSACVDMSSEVHPRRTMFLANLANGLDERFEHYGLIDDLNRCIDILEGVNAVLPFESPERPGIVGMLGRSFNRRFEWIACVEDLERGIAFTEEAVNLTPNEDPKRASRLNDAALALNSRFTLTNSTTDINKSIMYGREALSLRQGNMHWHIRALYMSSLGHALRLRFEQTQSLDDLHEAIALNQEAVELTPDSNPHKGMYLMNFGACLGTRASWTGSIEDSNGSITVFQEAIKLTPSDHPRRPAYLLSAIGAFHLRFIREGSTEDINRAIDMGEEALVSLHQDYHDRPALVSNLGVSYAVRAERLESIADLYRARELFEESLRVSHFPVDDLRRNDSLHNLGSALLVNFKPSSPSLTDIDKAIALLQEAIDETSNDSPNKASYLGVLGCAWQYRFAQTGSLDDLDLSGAMHEACIQLTAQDHAARAKRLTNLADALRIRFEKTGSQEDLKRAGEAYEQAAYDSVAPPTERIIAAVRCAEVVRKANLRHSSLLLRHAVGLLPSTSSRSLNRQDQQTALSSFRGLSNQAAAYAIEAGGTAFQALQLLEVGRGVMASHLFDARADITDLYEAHPELGEKFRRIQERLDSLEAGRNLYHTQTDSTAETHKRHLLLAEFNETIRVIRTLPTFESFLLGPTEAALMSLAEQGPIVVLNIAQLRCDAIIVTTDKISALSLPKLRYEDAKNKSGSLATLLNQLSPQSYGDAKRYLKEILEWAWDVAVAPVLLQLGYCDIPSPGSDWPRIWWVAVDCLSSIPIHAAGIHANGSTQNCLDRVISSYIPTLRSLTYARERKTLAESSRQFVKKITLISMPTTPNRRDLTAAESEVSVVDGLVPIKVTKTHLRTPHTAEAIRHIVDSEIVHFACHGNYDDKDPSRSSLSLQDWETNPLSVANLAALDLRKAQFAYLSACHAASNRSGMLLDEGIHLAGACHLAGFPSVIGTLWRITDHDSVSVASDVYGTMCKESGIIDVGSTAEGLHLAVRRLREETRKRLQFHQLVEDDPLIWAPYIHVGA